MMQKSKFEIAECSYNYNRCWTLMEAAELRGCTEVTYTMTSMKCEELEQKFVKKSKQILKFQSCLNTF